MKITFKDKGNTPLPKVGKLPVGTTFIRAKSAAECILSEGEQPCVYLMVGTRLRSYVINLHTGDMVENNISEDDALIVSVELKVDYVLQ